MSKRNRDKYIGVELGGRFEIVSALADGGMARVYAANDKQRGERVAVKVLRVSKNREVYIRRMRREAEALLRLGHPNIVSTYDHGPTEFGDYYIAMELIDGVSLTTFIREKGTAPRAAISLLLQACSAIRHAHRKNIVHRDLKASNLLVTVDDEGARVKLIDFGVVQVDGKDSISGKSEILGSVHTMAPEQVRGERVDHRADIYALGVLGFRLVAGRYPFHSRVPTETLALHVHGDIPRLEDERGMNGLADVLERCLQKSPDDRYPDVTRLMDAFSEVLDVPTAVFVRPLLGSLPPKRDDLPRWPLFVGAAAVFGLVALGTYLALS